MPHGAATDRNQRNAARAAIFAAPEFKRHRLIQLIAIRLADAINHETGWTFMGQERLASDLGVRRQAVQGALTSLIGQGVAGNSYKPALSRAYFHRASSPSRTGGRPMYWHCLAAVPMTGSPADQGSVPMTGSPADVAAELQTDDRLSRKSMTGSPANRRQAEPVAKSVNLLNPSEAGSTDSGSPSADAAGSPSLSPAPANGFEIAPPDELGRQFVTMNLPEWVTR